MKDAREGPVLILFSWESLRGRSPLKQNSPKLKVGKRQPALWAK